MLCCTDRPETLSAVEFLVKILYTFGFSEIYSSNSSTVSHTTGAVTVPQCFMQWRARCYGPTK